MICVIELWNAKDAWKKLSKEDREVYLSQISLYLQRITKQGVEIGSWGVNTVTTSHRANFDFFAVWKFPNQEMVEEFAAGIEAAGWYDYFEQVNLSGEVEAPEEVIERMIEH